MLKCKCGWTGVNLRPNYFRNTAHCPKCDVVFAGITAKWAISGYSREEEEKLVLKLQADTAVINMLSENVS
jgi:hypothetical protein